MSLQLRPHVTGKADTGRAGESQSKKHRNEQNDMVGYDYDREGGKQKASLVFLMKLYV